MFRHPTVGILRNAFGSICGKQATTIRSGSNSSITYNVSSFLIDPTSNTAMPCSPATVSIFSRIGLTTNSGSVTLGATAGIQRGPLSSAVGRGNTTAATSTPTSTIPRRGTNEYTPPIPINTIRLSLTFNLQSLITNYQLPYTIYQFHCFLLPPIIY